MGHVLDFVFWVFVIGSMIWFFVYLYRQTRTEEELQEELRQHLIDQLREAERRDDD